ncbi:MAG: sulfurtransferase [Betaproteobacteria bacterium]|nr:sulfurtransferase [Betaproteobacteria bacterium]
MLQLSAPALHALLSAENAEKPALLDVREPWEWQLARIDGAKHVPMGQIPERLDELDKSHPTVVICHHGTRSLQVVAFLQRQGFDRLHNLDGGIDAWSRQVDPGVAVY